MKIIRVRHKALVRNYSLDLEEKLTLYAKDMMTKEYTEIKAYEETKEGLWIPRALVAGPDDVEDAGWQPVEIDFKGSLKSFQVPIVNAWLKSGQGIICAGTGSGKTVMALYLAHKIGLKTLVVVHTETLFKQWIQRVKEFCGFYPTTIRSGHCDLSAPIVVGMLKTLAVGTKLPRRELYTAFGMTIFDEVHRVPSALYNVVAGMFWDKHRLGLSATPTRKDGMHKLAFWNIGEIVSSYTQTAVKPKIYTISYIDYTLNPERFRYRGDFILARALNSLAKSSERNMLIAYYCALAYKKGRRILVLSDRLEQLKLIASYLKHIGIKDIGFLTGDTKDLDHKIILGTYGAGGEGFDMPELDFMIMATPRTDVRQAIGRMLRPKDRQPIIIDIVDMVISEFKKFGAKRKQYYKNMGYEIKESIIERGKAYELYETLLSSK